MFEKLHKFIGKNIKALVERGDRPHCLRLQRNRVFYVREEVMRRATNVSRCGWFPTGVRGGRPVWRGWEDIRPGAMRRKLGQLAQKGCMPASMTWTGPQVALVRCAIAPAAFPHPLPPTPVPLPPQVARDKLVALGTCIGKFTHSGKFRVTIGALDLLAQYAKYKVGCTAAQLR